MLFISGGNKVIYVEVIDLKTDQCIQRYILINLELDKNIFTLLNIYAPNDLRLRNIFFKSLDQLLKQSSLGLKLVASTKVITIRVVYFKRIKFVFN